MSTDLAPYRGRPLSRRERKTAVVLKDEQLPAKRAAARLQAAALVANIGMVNIELLSGLEAQAVKRQGATVDARIGSVVDVYSGLVCTELSRLALEGE